MARIPKVTPAPILLLHAPDISSHCKSGIHTLGLSCYQGAGGADRAQLLDQVHPMVVGASTLCFTENLCYVFQSWLLLQSCPNTCLQQEQGREFLCRTGSITSLCSSSGGLNPQPSDLKDNLYSVKDPAANV